MVGVRRAVGVSLQSPSSRQRPAQLAEVEVQDHRSLAVDRRGKTISVCQLRLLTSFETAALWIRRISSSMVLLLCKSLSERYR